MQLRNWLQAYEVLHIGERPKKYTFWRNSNNTHSEHTFHYSDGILRYTVVIFCHKKTG